MISIEGQIVSHDGHSRGRIEIDNNGIIGSVAEATGQADLVFGEELIFPGFIDLHVHARECASHSQDYKEDFVSAGLAAINGGLVAVADMPNNPVPPVDDESYAMKAHLAKKCAVEVLVYAGLGPLTKPLGAAAPYKVFMGKSVGDLFFENFSELERALALYRGQAVSFHCEDPNILRQNLNRPSHESQRPESAEVSAVDVALGLIEKFALQGKFCHVSTQAALEKIKAAKQQGLPVTAEVTPHHLYFDQTMISSSNRTMFQVNPPIRQTPENRLALIQGLKNGDIDYLATDHAPHTLAEKQQGMSGLPHLDTYGPFTTWLMREHGFTPQDVARAASQNPARFFNQFSQNKYGKIAKGYIGSLTVLDVNKPIKIDKSKLKTKAGWSPFEGMSFPGQVAATIIKGHIHRN